MEMNKGSHGGDGDDDNDETKRASIGNIEFEEEEEARSTGLEERRAALHPGMYLQVNVPEEERCAKRQKRNDGSHSDEEPADGGKVKVKMEDLGEEDLLSREKDKVKYLRSALNREKKKVALLEKEKVSLETKVASLEMKVASLKSTLAYSEKHCMQLTGDLVKATATIQNLESSTLPAATAQSDKAVANLRKELETERAKVKALSGEKAKLQRELELSKSSAEQCETEFQHELESSKLSVKKLKTKLAKVKTTLEKPVEAVMKLLCDDAEEQDAMERLEENVAGVAQLSTTLDAASNAKTNKLGKAGRRPSSSSSSSSSSTIATKPSSVAHGQAASNAKPNTVGTAVRPPSSVVAASTKAMKPPSKGIPKPPPSGSTSKGGNVLPCPFCPMKLRGPYHFMEHVQGFALSTPGEPRKTCLENKFRYLGRSDPNDKSYLDFRDGRRVIVHLSDDQEEKIKQVAALQMAFHWNDWKSYRGDRKRFDNLLKEIQSMKEYYERAEMKAYYKSDAARKDKERKEANKRKKGRMP